MPELPQGVERYELAIELGRTGVKDPPVAEPSLDGDWIKVSALPQLHKTWAEGLLSEEVVEAVLRLSEQREASELRSEKMLVEECADAERGQPRAEVRKDHQAAIQATTGEGDPVDDYYADGAPEIGMSDFMRPRNENRP